MRVRGSGGGLLGLVLIGATGGFLVFRLWKTSTDLSSLAAGPPLRVERSAIPERAFVTPSGFSPKPSPAPSASPRPSRVLHDVPFVSQAPTGSWAQPYQDACEEAALLMARLWLMRETVTRAEADRELLAMIKLETARFGDYRDTSAAQTVELFRAFYKRDALRLVPSATLDDVKRELAAGRLVILPMAGRRLRGPYYRPPGPLYHMLLLRGYDEEQQNVIVNDPGTRTKGKAFRFSYAAIERSWNDWDPARGALAVTGASKPMIVVEKNARASARREQSGS